MSVSTPSDKPQEPRKRARKGAGAEGVRAALTVDPGITGAEVVRLVKGQYPQISERTVRTTLRRLKGDGEIEQREGRWYLVPQLRLEDV